MVENNNQQSSYSQLTGFHRAVPIILIATAVFCGLCFITQDIGALGHIFSGVFLGLFSYGAYVIPFLILLHAVFYPSDLAERRLLSRAIFSLITTVAVSALVWTVQNWGADSISFTPSQYYAEGQELIGGGFVGSTIAYGLTKVFGSVGLIIIALAVFAIYVSYFFAKGKYGVGRIGLAILRGIVGICAFFERKIVALRGKAKKSKEDRRARRQEEKQAELSDDEFFAVDNGIEKLRISELGINETKAKESIESNPTLQGSVFHKSRVSDEEAAQMEMRDRMEEMYRAEASEPREDHLGLHSPSSTPRKKTVTDPRYALTSPDEEIFSAAAPAVSEAREKKGSAEPADFGINESAESVFSGDFDPFKLAMSDELANKPSSRSLLDEEGATFTETINDLTEEEAERARRNEAFERRKAQIVGAHKTATPVTNEGEYTGTHKNVEFRETTPAERTRDSVEEESFSVTIDKAESARTAAEEYKPFDMDEPDVRFERPAAATEQQRSVEDTLPTRSTYTDSSSSGYASTAPSRDSVVAQPRSEDTVAEPRRDTASCYVTSAPDRAQSAYRRAAEFSTVRAEQAPAGNTPSYTAPSSNTSNYGYTPAASVNSQQPISTAHTATRAPEESSGGSEDPAFKPYTVPEEKSDGLVFEFDPVEEEAKVAEQFKVERTVISGESEENKGYSPYTSFERPTSTYVAVNLGDKTDEDDIEDDIPFEDVPAVSAIEEEKSYGESPSGEVNLFDEEPCDDPDDDGEMSDEEIPEDQRNPKVTEYRDMFTCFRNEESEASSQDSESDTDSDFDDDGEIEEYDSFAEDTATDSFTDSFDTDDDSDGEYSDSDSEEQSDEDEPPFVPSSYAAPKKEEPKKEEPKPEPKKKADYSHYKMPPIELLGLEAGVNDDEISNEIAENTRTLIETLESFNVTASIKGVDRGPRITRYEVVPARGVKVNAITHLFDDIALNLAAEGIRMEAPIPGKSAIGFEIPNKHPTPVRLRELLECEEFVNAKSKTIVCIGKDVAGNPVFGDIAKFPHALVAGATGMGKSVCINSIMISMLYKARPDEVKFIMIDPKKVEFKMYSGIPHLLIPVITEAKQAAGALMWAVEEMERRYDLIEKLNIRNIEAYNERCATDKSIGDPLPKIVIVIDELNDLMMQVRDPVEDLIMRIAQKARAAGIHLIIGTQRPDVKVVTGTIKANINTRISCKVTSVVDSRTILEMAGAEKLLNKGDMLFKPVDKTKPVRVQGALVLDSEVEDIMNFLKSETEGEVYDDEIFAEINKAAQKCGNKKSGGGGADADDGDDDSFGYYNDQQFLDAVELAIRSGKISTSLLQRKLSIGYGKAAKYIDAMEEIGVVSEPNGQKPRDVLITLDEWHEKLTRVEI